MGAFVVDIYQRTQTEKTFLSSTATQQALEKMSNSVFLVYVCSSISVTIASVVLKISPFDSLMLVVALLDCFDS